MADDFSIRNMEQSDWETVSRIYQQGMDTNKATFETECPSWELFNESHSMECRLVILLDNDVIGWAALSPVSDRCIYTGVADISIYIENQHTGKGAGTALMQALIQQSEKAGYWTLQSGIMSDNTQSVKLHEKCGFRLVGFRERIGKDRFGIWRDTLLFERRTANELPECN